MSDKKPEAAKPAAPAKAPSNNKGGAEAAHSDKCRFELCKDKSSKFGFCQTHYEMYMAGVIRGDGARPVDFEKKFEAYKTTRKVA